MSSQRQRKLASDREFARAREVVRERAGGRCEAKVPGICLGVGYHAHHVVLRSQGGPNLPRWMLWLCYPCHDWAHLNRADAHMVGLIKSRWEMEQEIADEIEQGEN